MRRLSSGWPGLIAGPVSPPLITASRESTRKPLNCLAGQWHFWQLSTSSGRIVDSKKRSCSADGGDSAVASPAARVKQIMADNILIAILKRFGLSRPGPMQGYSLTALGCFRCIWWERKAAKNVELLAVQLLGHQVG